MLNRKNFIRKVILIFTLKYFMISQYSLSMFLNYQKLSFSVFFLIFVGTQFMYESESHSVMSNSLWLPWTNTAWNSPGQNTGVGSRSLLQQIFPTQGLNSGLPHCRQILYQLSHKGRSSILKWVAYPFSSRSSWPRNLLIQVLLHCRWILYQLSYEGSPQTIQVWSKSNPSWLYSGNDR